MENSDFSLYRKGAASVDDKTKQSVRREKSYVEVSKKPWPIYNSGLEGEDAFDQTFEPVIPEQYRGLQQYVETELAEYSGRAVGVELGGSGSQLFAGFTPGFFKQSFGCTLLDNRSANEKTDDLLRNHQLVVGNAFSSEGRRALRNALHSEKIHFLIERLEGGLPGSLTDVYAATQLDWYYQQFGDEAIILLQLPNIEFKKEGITSTEEFVRRLQALGTFDVAWKDGWNPVLRIQKLKGAPASLEVLR